MPKAYYNEFDPYAAQWLRNLIAAGHIAPGDVDERNIEDVKPGDLTGYTQCHFFAGIGVWSLALRRAGWPDSRPVWTGSCPCQPFSAAGKGNGFADERHLWPAWFHLISQCQPNNIFGEQVAAADGLAWLDVVQADLEAAGYTGGTVDLCAAGIGAPHIRQRLWIFAELADAMFAGWPERGTSAGSGQTARSGGTCWMADANQPNVNEWPKAVEQAQLIGGGPLVRMDNPHDAGLEGFGSGYQTPGGRPGPIRPIATASEFGGLGDSANKSCEWDAGSIFRTEEECGSQRQQDGGGNIRFKHAGSSVGKRQPGPVNGFWNSSDWLLCRDGKWRPVEPSTFPLAHGAAARVGRLRAYGNAINAEAAEAIIRAYMECRP